MKKKTGLIFALVLVLSACAPSESAVQTAIARTQLAWELLTPTVTFTPLASNTPIWTPTNTPTLTPTPTNTHLPVTLTAVAVAKTATRLSVIATQTRSSQLALQTAAAATSTHLASFPTIYWKEFTTYPENHTGEKIRVQVRVFNIPGSYTIQAYIHTTYEPVYIETSNSFSGIYNNDLITVYGVVGGKKCFENTMGTTICHPYIKKAYITKP